MAQQMTMTATIEEKETVKKDSNKNNKKRRDSPQLIERAPNKAHRVPNKALSAYRSLVICYCDFAHCESAPN